MSTYEVHAFKSMTIGLYDSAIYGSLFADDRIVAIFSDQQRVNVLVDVEVALARVQAELGIIPKSAAITIEQNAKTFEIDFEQLREGTKQSGVPVINLVTQLRRAVEKEAAQYIHYGATSQDIVDTAHVIQLRAAIDCLREQLNELIQQLGVLADIHRNTLMAARTRSQQASPTTFGLKVAGWLLPLVRHRQRLIELEPRLLSLQLGGAVGTLAALTGKGVETKEALARELKLSSLPVSWHTQRDNMAEFAGWLSLVSGSLGKIGTDIIALSQSEIAEVAENGMGASSTLPHKSNPINSEMLVTVAQMNTTLLSNMHHALIAEHERATHSWQLEWNTLPQMVCGTSAALGQAMSVIKNLSVDEARMLRNVENSKGLLLAERAMFVLMRHMDREQAQNVVKSACANVKTSGKHLMDILKETTNFPVEWDDYKDPADYLGESSTLIDRVLAAAKTE